MNASEIIDLVTKEGLAAQHADLNWNGTFDDYLDMVSENPQIARTAFKRMYDMIESYGYETYTEYKKKITHWNFFDDPIDGGKDAVFGLDIHLMKLVNVLKAGAYRYGPEKRVILLHGPVGSAKSTIARMLKKGLELYSKTAAGSLYTYDWIDLKTIVGTDDKLGCPMHEDPLHLIPDSRKDSVLELLNKNRERHEHVHIEGSLCPSCRYIYNRLLDHYNGD